MLLAAFEVVATSPEVAGPAHAAVAASSLTLGQTLGSGQQLTSPNGSYVLVMQGDGNLVQYAGSRARWQTGTYGHPGAVLRLQSDGNLVVVGTDNRPLWNSGTFGARAAVTVTMQSDGNEVGYASGGNAVWSSGTLHMSSPTYRSPDGKFVAAMQSNGNYTLTYTYNSGGGGDVLWSTGTAGHPEAYFVVQPDGNLVVYEYGRPLWSTLTYGNPGAALTLQSDGNFVLYSTANRPLYWTATDNAAAGIQSAGDSRFSLVWAHVLADRGSPVALGSPSVGTLDAVGPAAILGSRSGGLYAYHLSDGSTVAGWPGRGSVAIDSTPAVLGSGPTAQVLVGLGTSARPTEGGLLSVNADSSPRWFRPFVALPNGAGSAGAMSSPAVGRLQAAAGSFDVVSASMGQLQYAVSASNGAPLPGFPWFQADSNFSTPALADLDGTGFADIIEGGDSTAGNAFGKQYANGGHIRILTPTGHGASGNLGDGLKCSYDTDQVVQSSPAVGPILAGGATGIVVGTGSFYAGAADTTKLIAVDKNCALAWKAQLDGPTGASPALVDVLGNGTTAVVEGTNINPYSGTVYALNGATGAAIWQQHIPGGVFGSITSIDLGGGYQSLLVPTPAGVFILDGKTGAVVNKLISNVGVLNTVLVTRDPNGAIGVTVAGYNGLNNSVVMHYRLTGSSVATVSGHGQWPMFHADPHLSGVAPS